MNNANEPDLALFLCYRRSDTSAVAGRLYDLLTAEFGRREIFFDVDQIPVGRDFRSVIVDAVAGSNFFLILIGPNFLDSNLQSEFDFVRIEIEAALRANTRIVPLLVDDAQMPPPSQLPASIRELSYLQALRLSRANFRTGVEQLIVLLKRDARTDSSTDALPTPSDLAAAVAEERSIIFISYAHEDEHWLKRVQIHLKPLTRRGRLELWDDTQISVGDEWKTEIRTALRMSRAAILLVSADFLASDFIYEDELPPLLMSAQKEGVKILPVIVSSSSFEDSELARFQALNPPSKPLDQMAKGEQEATLARLNKSVRHVLETR
jgi:hypothetical protein